MSIIIGNIRVNKGEKKTGFLTAVDIPVGTINIPITVINGSRSGPILAITAGVHGCEYPGIRGAQIVASKTRGSELKGALVIVHAVNVPGFRYQTAFVNPLDGVNLNRIWPGTVGAKTFYGAGSISHHIANVVYEEVQKKATHYIDLHGGDLPEAVPHYAACVLTGDDKVDNVSRTMMKYSLASYIRPGQQRTGHTTDSAAELRIPNILLEAGRGGLLEEEHVRAHVNAIYNIIRYLGMIEGEPVEPSGQRTIARGVGIRAGHSGFFEHLVEPGCIVSNGQTIGVIYDIFGRTVEEIKSPIDGVITIINFRPPKCTGDPLFSIAKLVK
jgi:predicted deacylase